MLSDKHELFKVQLLDVTGINKCSISQSVGTCTYVCATGIEVVEDNQSQTSVDSLFKSADDDQLSQYNINQ